MGRLLPGLILRMAGSINQHPSQSGPVYPQQPASQEVSCSEKIRKQSIRNSLTKPRSRFRVTPTQERWVQMRKAIGMAACAVLLSCGTRAVAQNVVTDWNAIAITQARASTAPGATSAGGTSLYLAYVQLAVYNAVNAIDGRFQP